MSPLCWDLAHIGHYEELWLVRDADRRGAHGPARSTTSTTRSSTRVAIGRRSPILDPARRARATSPTCASACSTCSTPSTLDGDGEPLLADGFVYGMVVQHEHQHDETMLATLQLMDDFAHPDAGGTPVAPRVRDHRCRCRRRRAVPAARS